MKLIPLTQGKFAMVDDADYDAVIKFKWYAWKDRTGVWYARRNVRKSDGTSETQSLHRFLMPGKKMVDHWDGNGLNNCRNNLRPCSSSQNQGNRQPDRGGTSKLKGVSWRRDVGKWVAQIWFQSKKYYLGLFTSEEDAARAYDAKAKELHKEFARPNFS